MNSSMPAAVHSVSEPGMNCLTIRSTIARGAGWSTPSWVGNEAQVRGPRPGLQPRQRRSEQDQAADTVGMVEAKLERHATAHAVAHDVSSFEFERVEQRDDRAGEERRVVSRPERLVGVAEAG